MRSWLPHFGYNLQHLSLYFVNLIAFQILDMYLQMQELTGVSTLRDIGKLTRVLLVIFDCNHSQFTYFYKYSSSIFYYMPKIVSVFIVMYKTHSFP